jgi:hypothetical protein
MAPKNRATKPSKAKAPTAIASKPDRADPAERARAEVQRLNSQELGLSVLYRVRAAELGSVRAERGDQVLDAENPTGAARASAQRVAVLVDELEALADASRRARERRLAAIPAIFKAQADEADRAAAQLESEADQLEVRSKGLRKALEEHDECSYQPAPVTFPERAVGGPLVGGAPVVVQIRVPRFERLRLAAADKRAEAVQHRLKEPHQAGGVEADDLAGLLEEVFRDPLRVGPTVDSIRSWSDQAIATERRRRERAAGGADLVPVDAPMRLHLEWVGGTIVQASSGVSRFAAPALSTYFDSAADMAQVGGPLEEPVGAGQFEEA